MTVTGSTEVTALQVGSAGLGKIQQELDELRETNPEKAKVVETVIGLATGGPLKTAIGEAINQGIELASSASDNVANAMGTVAGYADDALNWVGGIIEKDNAENFALNVADEHANPTEEIGELGNSSVDVKDGVRLIATISGAGIGVGKKQTGTKEASGVGSGPDNNTLYTGGPHKDTSQPVGDGLDSHHCPAKSCYQNATLSIQDGPAIKMDPADHRKTSSYGNSAEAQAYRAEQQRLINEGQVREAIKMDIDDIRRIENEVGQPGKYDSAIREMLDYSDSLDPNYFINQ